MGKYSFWSNFKFAYGTVFREKRVYIWDTILEILLSVLLPLAGTALSALVIRLLGDEKSAATVILCILTAFLAYGLANAAQTFVLHKHAEHNIEVRLELFYLNVIKKLMHVPLESYESAEVRLMWQKAGMAVSSNWEGIEGFFRYGTKLGVGVFGLILYACIAGRIHPLILVLLLALSAVSALIGGLPQWYQNRVKDKKAGYAVTMEYLNRVVDNVPAGKDIRVFGLGPWMVQKYDKAIMGSRRLDAGRNMLAFVASVAEITCSAARDFICCFYLIHCMQNGMKLSEFVFCLGVIAGFSGWFGSVSDNWIRMRGCSRQISDIRAFLDLPREDGEKEIPEQGFDKIDIVFEHVSYCYEDSDKPVLKDVSFHIAPGEHVALVGLNGAGKTTVAKLMAGLYLPTEGEIYINGISTRKLDKKEYFGHQAAVFQDTFVLAYTIGENIALCEDVDEKRAWKCLEMAGLSQKVKSLPDGLLTYLGKDLSEQGIALSGGETQKLLLARALYRNPALILLDEPTAALDALAESEIYEIYNSVLAGVTSLFISHRLASTRFCSQVILLSDGEIVEQGSHGELMKKQGRYHNLFQIQSKYYEEGGDENVNEGNVEIPDVSD